MKHLENLKMALFASYRPTRFNHIVHIPITRPFGYLAVYLTRPPNSYGLQELKNRSHIENSVVVISGADGFTTDLSGCLQLLRLCGNECLIVFMAKGLIFVAARVWEIVISLEIFINLDLPDNDLPPSDLYRLFAKWRRISAIKQNQMHLQQRLRSETANRNRHHPIARKKKVAREPFRRDKMRQMPAPPAIDLSVFREAQEPPASNIANDTLTCPHCKNEFIDAQDIKFQVNDARCCPHPRHRHTKDCPLEFLPLSS
jgi:hypothetical protein